MKIVTVPSKILLTPTKPVVTINARIQKLVREMERTLMSQKDPEGVGLAAPQVGISLSLFIIKQTSESATEVYINPKILSDVSLPTPDPISQKKARSRMEGCLSIPHIWGPLVRVSSVRLEYQTLDGAHHIRTFNGFKAVIIQHEVDHLNGMLFTMRCIEQATQMYEERGGELKAILTP